MIHLRLAKEYLAEPIFCSDVENMGHVSLADLSISDGLRGDIIKWDHEYQNTFNEEYPPDSGFGMPEEEVLHVERGAKLAERLQIELGG